MQATRHFLGWDAPLSVKVGNFLLPRKIDGPADFSDRLIVAPTRQAGRRLREALALRCAERGSALLGACIVTPAYFFSEQADPGVADRTLTTALWADILLKAELSEYGALLPSGVPERSYDWALRTAGLISDLRDELSEGGLLIGDVVERFAAELEESDRWQDLARLEAAYLARLGAQGLADPCQAKLRRAESPRLPDRVKRVIIAAVPDPALLMIRALERVPDGIPIEILVHAPESESACFDGWGRPISDEWRRRAIRIPDEQQSVMLASSPAEQARATLELIAREAGRIGPNDVAVGVPDRSLAPFLAAQFEKHGLESFDPADRPVSDSAVYRLVESFCRIVTDGSYRFVGAWLRHPDVLAYFKDVHDVSPLRLLKELDEFQNEFLPGGLDDISRRLAAAGSGSGGAGAREFSGLEKAVVFISGHVQSCRNGAFAEGMSLLLRTVYEGRKVRSDVPADREFRQVAERFNEALAELAAGRLQALAPDVGSVVGLFLRRLGELTYHPQPADAAIDMEGWLELAWNDAPLLVVTGMNEGSVPGGRLDHVFLPDSLRVKLKLHDDADRLARDAFLMTTLIESRRAARGARFVVGKTGVRGDPLKPSRLFFLCGDGELPGRARRLFGSPDERREDFAPSVSFKLDPNRAAASARKVETLHVTAFRDYLKCPFRFYLKHVLRMEELTDRKNAMDGLDIGTVVHGVFERFGRNGELRRCADAKLIESFLVAELERGISDRFGPSPSLAVRIQVESLKQRLAAAAAVQARLASDGWEIIEVERKCRLATGGMEITGKIDRIDRHIESGSLRVIDYKTSDTAKGPDDEHLGPVRADTPDYAKVVVAGREMRWLDLQLPMYGLMLGADGAGARLCYFDLPKAIGGTCLSEWSSFDESMMQSARGCAEAVVEAVRNGRFWPPAGRVEFDEFEELFVAEPEECFEDLTMGMDRGKISPAAERRSWNADSEQTVEE